MREAAVIQKSNPVAKAQFTIIILINFVSYNVISIFTV